MMKNRRRNLALLFAAGLLGLLIALLWTTNILAIAGSNETSSFLSRNSVASKEGWKVLLKTPRNQKGTATAEPTRTAETTARDDSNLHLVFSTGCSPFQDWQSYVFFYHAKKSGQQGQVTRVASGCEGSAAEAALIKTHEEQVRPLSSQFHLHITPNYARTIPGKNYKFFNKPFGLRHWMEQVLGFSADNSTEHDDTVFIILDPDQLILRPFEKDFGGQGTSIQWHLNVNPNQPIRVEHDRPFAQYYQMMGGWVNQIYEGRWQVLATLKNATQAAATNSHLHTMLNNEKVKQHYLAGPPYMATGRDMYKIVSTWATFAVPVYELTHNHLSEMYAYSTAAAHWNLPHQLAYSFMVSNIGVKYEAWSWVDSQENSSVICEARDYYSDTVKRATPRHYLPNVLHYCQRYFLGPYFFSKYILPKKFLVCDHPLLVEPEVDIADKYNTSVTPNGVLNKLPKQVDRNRMTFMLCHMIARLNEAASYWKHQHCDAATANFQKTFVFKRKDT